MLYLYISLAFFAGFAFVSGLNLLVADVIEDRRKHQAIRVREELRLRSAERARAEWKKSSGNGTRRPAEPLATGCFAIRNCRYWTRGYFNPRGLLGDFWCRVDHVFDGQAPFWNPRGSGFRGSPNPLGVS